MRIAALGVVLVGLAAAACAPARGGLAAAGPASGEVAMVNVPSCDFRVIQQLSGQLLWATSTHPDARPVQQQARALGADAVMDYRAVREFDRNGNVNAISWTAVAIAYWDRNDPKCYRNG